jgi:NhaP-type Na+/H+ or K+/H+ antiporter
MELGLALFAIAIVLYAALASRLARWSITMPMVFVAVGFVLGPGVTGLLPLTPGVESVKLLTEVTLALLLFADASTLDFAQIRLDARLPLRLLMLGLPLTMLLGTLFAIVIVPVEGLAFAALLGAILAPTDAALGLPIFNNRAIPVLIRRALNVESGLNDGIATPFVTLALAFAAASETATEGHWLTTALTEIGLAVLVGVAVGVLGGRLLSLARRRRWTSAGSARLAVLGLALVAYFASVAMHGNGFIAAFVGGLAFGAAVRNGPREQAEFTEEFGTGLSFLVWGVFGAVMVSESLRLTTDWRPIVYAVVSLTLVRMVAVAIALLGSHLRRDTVLLMGWFGPRGLASVVFTLLAYSELEAAGKPDAVLLTVATWTILLSVVLHGLTAKPLADWYARRLAAADGTQHELTELPELGDRRTILATPHHVGND